MIIDRPTTREFEQNGIAFLNLAWASILEMSLELDFAENENPSGLTKRDRIRTRNRFWKEAQHQLSVAVSLTQQGTEFLLKSKITAVSPYLLLADEPRRWPSGCDKNDVPFSEFKTVEAQDLIRIHDTVCGSRLPDPFKIEFERLRKLRNIVMHSISRNKFEVRDVVLPILLIAETLIGSHTWLNIRKKAFSKKADVWAAQYYDYNELASFARETMHVLDELLQPAEAKRFYNFNPKRRRYLCYGCSESNFDFYSDLAQLVANRRTRIYCICCDETRTIKRKSCSKGSCRGDVFDDDWGACLTCGG